MKKKNRSEVSLRVEKSVVKNKEEEYLPPLDELTIQIHELIIPDDEPKAYVLMIAFFDQLLVSSVITSTGGRGIPDNKKTIAAGRMKYDPSNYEKMCLFADNPLTIRIYPYRGEENIGNNASYGSPQSTRSNKSSQSPKSSKSTQSNKSNLKAPNSKPDPDAYCCNIDILPIFTELNKINLQSRLEPMVKPSVLLAKSWNNLPLITLTLKATRNPANIFHQQMLMKANFMKVTLIGSYNMIVPFDDAYDYAAATKLPLHNEMHTVTFTNGCRLPKRFNSMSFYPHWESLKIRQDFFPNGFEKYESNLGELQNENNIDVNYFLNEQPAELAALWASFHRVLLLEDTEEWLSKYLRNYKWPLEVHAYGENNKGFSFMGFIDLFHLLYPGENRVRIVVPLQWSDSQAMMVKCGCQPLLTPADKAPSAMSSVHKSSKATTTTGSAHASTVTEITCLPRPTGSDDHCAFAIVEVSLARPFKKPSIPRHITESEIKEMLFEMEAIQTKRECTGRGQLDRDWQTTVRAAASSLRRVPYFGLTDLCTVNRQLSESRTRVELVTSFWQDAAIYVNNNFVVRDFLHSDAAFEEMVMIAHACLVRLANEALQPTLAAGSRTELAPAQRAARHARQLQDLPHAVELYLQVLTAQPREAGSWRELATCLRDVDHDWANVCINKAVKLNPRHPLSLLSKGGAVFDIDPDAAEPFFTALMALYPFYTCLWVAANAYYLHQELYHMAQEIMEQVKKTEAEGLSQEMPFPRAWERELGDWWDHTPLLPGTSRYYDAADLLLRLRAVSLAEICIAQAFSENGESAVYYHMVALCCRIRGNVDDALCHIKQGVEKYGEINYLKSLEGECFHKRKELTASMAAFEKNTFCSSPYITLLSLPRHNHARVHAILTDLTRRHPNAYAWMAFADYWMTQSAMGEGGDADATEEQRAGAAHAATCALNALRCDRRAGRAWALLATLLQPAARRRYCREMAVLCGENKLPPEKRTVHTHVDAQQSFCFRIGKALRECRCQMCEHLSL